MKLRSLKKWANNLVVLIAVFALIINAFAIPVCASANKMEVSIETSVATVYPGDTVTVTIKLTDINKVTQLQNGIEAVNFSVLYDSPTFAALARTKGENIPAGQDFSSSNIASLTSGKKEVRLVSFNNYPADDITGDPVAAPIPATDGVFASFNMTVAANATPGDYTLSFDQAATGLTGFVALSNTPNLTPVSDYLTFNSTTITVAAPALGTPTNVALSNKIANWDVVTNNSGYTVNLYKDGTITAVYSEDTSTNTLDLTNHITSVGSYTVKVIAKGTGSYSNSLESAASAPQVVTETLTAPTTVTLGTNKTATWSAVANNSGYTVNLYKDGAITPAYTGSAATDATTLDLVSNMTVAGSYTVKVITKGTGNYVTSAESAASAPLAVNETLTAPTNVVLANKTATWNAVANNNGYTVNLYKDAVYAAVYATADTAINITTLDLTNQMTDFGSYTVKVIAKGTGNYSTSAESAASAAQVLAPADKVALQAAITLAGTKVQGAYTPDSWSAMQTALSAAITVNANTGATDTEIATAVTNLNNAISALVTRPEFTVSATKVTSPFIKVTANVTYNYGPGHAVVVFQLMNGTTPVSVVSMEKDIATHETVSALFPGYTTGTVTVMVLDSLTVSTTQTGNIIATTQTL